MGRSASEMAANGAAITRRGVLIGGAALTAACGPRGSIRPVTVFAAASLTDALTEIAADHETATRQPVRLSFGASGSVARQVLAGAPADIVILAEARWMDRLQQAGLLATGGPTDLLRNRLVVIARADRAVGADPFRWLAETDERLAIGDPESVPAGRYARDWLTQAGVWESVRGRVVTASDVRAVRTFVERGEAGLGVAYVSDTVGATGLRIVGGPEAGRQPTIVYPMALTRSASPQAAGFAARLRGPEARAVFVRHGFQTA